MGDASFTRRARVSCSDFVGLPILRGTGSIDSTLKASTDVLVWLLSHCTTSQKRTLDPFMRSTGGNDWGFLSRSEYIEDSALWISAESWGTVIRSMM